MVFAESCPGTTLSTLLGNLLRIWQHYTSTMDPTVEGCKDRVGQRRKEMTFIGASMDQLLSYIFSHLIFIVDVAM